MINTAEVISSNIVTAFDRLRSVLELLQRWCPTGDSGIRQLCSVKVYQRPMIGLQHELTTLKIHVEFGNGPHDSQVFPFHDGIVALCTRQLASSICNWEDSVFVLLKQHSTDSSV